MKFFLALSCTIGLFVSPLLPAFSSSGDASAKAAAGAHATAKTMTQDGGDARMKALATDSGAIAVKKYPVFVVTDRLMTANKYGVDFVGERSSTISYASATWSEQKDKVEVSGPDVCQSRQQFLAKLKETGASKIAVFIPGYRRSFQSSLESAGEIAARLDEPVVLFAWPSKNKYSAYMIDECTAEWSSHDLADALKCLGDQFGNQNVRIIAHSVGVRMACWAFGDLAQTNQLARPFKSAFLFSPDMDRDVFLADAPLIKRACSAVKIFVDEHDSRLWLSKVMHGGPRLGDARNRQLVTEVLQQADFDTTMQTHRLTHELVTSVFPKQPEPPVASLATQPRTGR